MTDQQRVRLASLVGCLVLISLVGFQLIRSTPLWADTSLGSQAFIQPYLQRAEQQVTEFQLDNGIKFIVFERHQAPVASFVTYADVGTANETLGKTGTAHFLEHLAFKGTTQIGTTNYPTEKQIFEQMDQVFRQLKQAQTSGTSDDIDQLEQQFNDLKAQAGDYVQPNEFAQIVEQEGGRGLNAATSMDATRYFYSLPSNKLELWMSLESERFLDPVFREFYEEKEVVLEERRAATDNSPIGQMIEAFQATAFKIHPYGRPVIGYADDLVNLERQDIQAFFDQYYVPGNLTMVIVGDIEPDQVRQLAQTYFGRFPARPDPAPLTLQEPPQAETREVVLDLPSEPWYLEGYHRPGVQNPDDPVYDIITSLMSNGRTSRLYKALVETGMALTAQGFNGFPGDKYPNLIMFYALTAPDHTLDDIAQVLQTEIERLKTEPVARQDLERVKTQAQVALLKTLDSNAGLARLLAEFDVKTGSWRNLFQQLEILNQITPADIQRVAQQTFQSQNRTVGKLRSNA